MSNAVLLSPHLTQEDLHHEQLEAFLSTSAEYLDVDAVDPAEWHAALAGAVHAGDRP